MSLTSSLWSCLSLTKGECKHSQKFSQGDQLVAGPQIAQFNPHFFLRTTTSVSTVRASSF